MLRLRFEFIYSSPSAQLASDNAQEMARSLGKGPQKPRKSLGMRIAELRLDENFGEL
jgi:hypothetical protein